MSRNVLIKYPGTKSNKKYNDKIIETLIRLWWNKKNRKINTFVEPFFGAGHVGQNFMGKTHIDKYIYNDADSSMTCLWYSIQSKRFYFMLITMILLMDFNDNNTKLAKYIRYKEEIKKLDIKKFNNDVEILLTAYKKLVLQNFSFGGLGPMSGGPRGGINQDKLNKIDCRFNATSIAYLINRLHMQFQKYNILITNTDFQVTLSNLSERALIYLDPPYYNEGKHLYQVSMTVRQHQDLAKYLKSSKHVWLLSYDDCPEIRKLYSWAAIEEYPVKYGSTKKNKVELLITRK